MYLYILKSFRMALTRKVSKMDKSKEDRLIEKIRKLFALSSNEGATGAEAETALRMANALLAKHAIDKHRLHEEDEVFCSFMDYNIKQKWVQTVIGHIGRFYNCRVIFDYNWDDPKTLVIGTSANRITAILVMDELIATIKKEGGKVDFKNGAAYGLGEKCREILASRQVEEEVIPGTGLTIIDIETQQKNNADAFVSSNFKHLTKSKGGGRMSEEGRKYGKGLNPNARMGGSAQKCLN